MKGQVLECEAAAKRTVVPCLSGGLQHVEIPSENSPKVRSAVALASMLWDYPTVPTTTADKKKRVVLPVARPGDVFDVQQQGEGKLLLVRLVRPEPKARMSRLACLRAISAAPLRPRMNWDELRRLTREP